MFIYKITNMVNNKCYIGYDSGDIDSQKRWLYHQKNYKYATTKVLYLAMQKYGLENFMYEVIEQVDTPEQLIDREIFHINMTQSHLPNFGYNRTLGGDGGDTFSNRTKESQDLTRERMRESTIVQWQNKDTDSRNDLLEHLRNAKWINTTPEDRKQKTAHLHTEEVYRKKSESLKQFYKDHPEIKKNKSQRFREWHKANPELGKKNSIKNGKKGAAKVSVKVKVITPDGEEKIYASKSEFGRQNKGHDINRIIMKTKNGQKHKGWMGWEI